jgi:hypothetical protein
MGDAKPMSLPVSDQNALVRGHSGEPQADQNLYQQGIGGLTWVAKGTQIDIAYVVGQLSQYCTQPTIRHWNTVRRILRYLQGTRDYVLVYGQDAQGLEVCEARLLGYSDADYAGDAKDRHSTTGHLFLLNKGPISWTLVKQRCMATSTTESEYIALAEAGKQSQWLWALLRELQCEELLGDSLAVPLLSDNQPCITIAQDPTSHNRTKHIDVRYHYIRQLAVYGKVTIDYIPTESMLADILTKPLAVTAFKRCIQGLIATGRN